MKESYVHHLETESHQYVCTYCGITTATPSKFLFNLLFLSIVTIQIFVQGSRRAHIQNSHAEKLLLCEDCGECQNDIMAHFVLHGYTFECKKCVKKFYNRERLNAHMEVHQDPIQCNWSNCDRMIATRSMLVTHYRGHKSEHKCSVCGQAFWNFAMLTSHLRSHQPMPRNPHVSRGNQMNRATIQYQNQARPSPSVLQRSKSAAQPMLSNSVIKCGHCNNLFRSTKDLSLHKCAPKYPNNGDQNKLLELASKATAQAKAVTNKMPARRRASPKKPQQPIEQQMIDLPAFHGQQPVDDDTQLIMILNQSTGELMEITAPKGMEVQDVINSLNFTPAGEDVQMEVIEEQPQEQSAFANMVDVEQQQESTNDIKQEHKIVPTNEQEETAAAIEVIEQVNDETASSVQHVVEENQQPTTSTDNHQDEAVVATNPEAETTTTVLIQQDGDGDHQVTHQIIDSDDPNGSQAIVLPPECINEDGSLILDAETLQRLNLAISVDENGTITTPDGNTTFIIDTSKE
ncbi:hypothetical protein BLA29_001059 [Euroglyphus maynei]|uniref:C2H2-type domain-containing protein n=1 Tax=Euroglyphus maynei TaxID=6958 RepID=A0A1Y3AS30_EURMA|nr:hypothetical protein BLA29_001059 [Euroglyphus maynei]